MLRTLHAILKFFIFFLLCFFIVPTQLLILLFTQGKTAYLLPLLWHKTICWAFGIKVSVAGSPIRDQQALFVSNHISYLDIPVIGSILPASFVAKSEVAQWPVFGFLAKLQQTSFLDRRRQAIAQEKEALSQRLNMGRSLIIFPEGTSTDGQTVLPFRSSLFSLVMGDDNSDLLIQPFTIKVQSANGRTPQTQSERDLYAWHINMDTDLHIHLWRFARSSGAEIVLSFHDPIRASNFKNRKVLAKTCHDQVNNGLT